MRFEEFESKFEAFERDSKHSNANSNDSKGIRTVRMQILSITKGFEAFESTFEALERDSNPLNANSNHSKRISSIQTKFEAYEPNL